MTHHTLPFSTPTDSPMRQRHDISVTEYRDLYDRVHRIVTALYLATRHIAESDRIYTSMRHCAMSFIDCIGYIRHTSSGDTFYQTILGQCENAIARVRLARQLGYISPANAGLLESELAYIYHLVEGMSLKSASQNNTEVSYTDEVSVKDILMQDRELLSEGEYSPREEYSKEASQYTTTTNSASYDRHTVARPTSLVFKKSSEKALVNHSLHTSSRRDQILAFIRNNGKASMRELADAMPLVSEKTLQRTLVALIDTGDIRRIGDRRWSHYEPAVQL